jgi:HTH-type transcriptional regulator, competence development regulator
MKFKMPREWLQKRLSADEKAEVSTGSLSLAKLVKDTNALRQTPYEQEKLASAFGWLIRSRRMEMRFSIARLAEKTDVDSAELEAIENNVHYIPGPRTVYQLAWALKLPEKQLMQLSGNLVVSDFRFSAQVERFAARAKRVDELTDDQHEVLREFVTYLAQLH